MARAPQVTRTIQTTKAKIMCLDLEKCEPFTKEITLPRTYKDDNAILKQAEKEINTATIKVVHVVESSVQETLYGMSEQEFIKAATVLPARGTKEAEATEENN